MRQGLTDYVYGAVFFIFALAALLPDALNGVGEMVRIISPKFRYVFSTITLCLAVGILYPTVQFLAKRLFSWYRKQDFLEMIFGLLFGIGVIAAMILGRGEVGSYVAFGAMISLCLFAARRIFRLED